MKVQFFVSNTNSKKTNIAVEQIVARSIDENVIVITPEQMTIEMQLKLLKKHRSSCIGNISVLSFERLAYTVNNEINFTKKALITDVGKDIVISKLLSDEKYEYLAHISGNRNALVESIREFFVELSRYIDIPNEYYEKINNINDKKLAKKIRLSFELYEQYKREINASYTSGETSIEQLIKNGYKSDYLKNSIIYIDGFVGFTPTQIRIINMFLSVASEINFFFNTSIGQLDNTDEKTNLYYETMTSYRAINTLLSYYPDVETKIEVVDDLNIQSEKKYIVNNLFSNKKNSTKNYNKDTSDVFLSDFSTRLKEVETVSAYIAKLVREDGYRYKDFIIYVSDIQYYRQILFEKLNGFDIPFYADKKDDLDSNDAVLFVFSIINLYYKKFDITSIMQFMKNYFSPFRDDTSSENERIIYYFENYCYAYNKRGLSSFSVEWKYKVPHLERTDELGDDILFAINEIRARFYNIFSEVKIKSKDTVVNYINSINHLLLNMDFEQKLLLRANYFSENNNQVKSDIYSQIYEKLTELFNQIKIVDEDVIISFDKFIKLMNTGKKSMSIAHIPSYVDEVIIGELSRSKINSRKMVFVLGLNDNLDLKVSDGVGFINDYERKQLEDVNINLAPTKKKRNVLERYYVYSSIIGFEEKLFLSYVKNDENGNKLHKSYTLKEIYDIFPKISSYKNHLNYSDFFVNKNIVFQSVVKDYRLKQIFDKNMLSKYENIKKATEIKLNSILNEYSRNLVFENKLITSVSRLEAYKACPKAFYIDYILGAKERDLATVEMPDIGNASHHIFEKIINEIMNSSLDYTEIDDEMIEKIVNKIAKNMTDDKSSTNNFKVFSFNATSMGHFERIKRQVKSSLNIMINQIGKGSFRPIKTEWNFNWNDEIYSPYDENKRFEIVGKIDRLDEMHARGVKYLSVVDYKTSEKLIDFSKVYSGLSLQLLVYVSIATKISKASPAGMQYFPVEDKPHYKLSYEKTTFEDKLKEHKIVTYVLDNEDVIKGYDKDFDGNSEYLKIKTKKDGTFTAYSKVFAKDEFDTMLTFVDKKIKDIAKEILSGDMSVKPYKYGNATACDYCNFDGICKFNPKNDKDYFNVIEEVNKKDIIESMNLFIRGKEDEKSN